MKKLLTFLINQKLHIILTFCCLSFLLSLGFLSLKIEDTTILTVCTIFMVIALWKDFFNSIATLFFWIIISITLGKILGIWFYDTLEGTITSLFHINTSSLNNEIRLHPLITSIHHFIIGFTMSLTYFLSLYLGFGSQKECFRILKPIHNFWIKTKPIFTTSTTFIAIVVFFIGFSARDISVLATSLLTTYGLIYLSLESR